jgi:hypothetical protein
MDTICTHCGAFHWIDERNKASPKCRPEFSRCCHHGNVSLDHLPLPPERLRTLFTNDSPNAKHFRERIRQYNSALAFTSFTAKEKEQSVNAGGGAPWVWKTGYTIYHRIGTLFPNNPVDPRYSQLYFYDPLEALDYRMRRNDKLHRETMQYLQDMLRDSNPYTLLFFHSNEVLERTPARELGIHIIADRSTDLRRYNAPIVDEVAVVLPGDDGHARNPRDIVLHPRGGDLQFIHDHHRSYAPLHYVLLFPFGTDGWSYGLHLQPGQQHRIADADDDEQPPIDRTNARNLTQVMFYSYRLHTHNDEFPILQYGGRLFQQYVCDVWISTDQNRLHWIEHNQPKLRASLYSGLEDAVTHGENDVDLHDVGHRVVLPSSYIGGPRYMNQCFQDAIALARFYEGFDLFVTFTCNPCWPEIVAELLPSQSASDRPDLTVRVFNMYKTALVNELVKDNIFGPSSGYVYTIEFQKRGLPHMHLLLSLSPASRLETAQQVDSVISASWPDPDRQPRLFDVVRRSMVHGPCGRAKPDAACMKDGVCSKGFPKPFQAETVLTRDGYPLYARPDDGRSFNVRGFDADNRWIVPYNRYLLSRCVTFVSGFKRFLNILSYDAHMNIECVMSLAAAKYITKYTHKGPDRATVELQQRDEVSDFVDTRYIAAAEAAWRIFQLPVHHQEPAVVSLQVHLPGHHLVVYNPNEPPDAVSARAEQETTMLTAFFALNREIPSARQYTYPELPLHFVWIDREKRWKERQIGRSIGRMYFVSPTAGERFYLRTLLTTVSGPTSWESLRTYENVHYATFHAACLARGLLENDDEWRLCLGEASLSHVGESLRRLFALILTHCTPAQPDVLWTEFRDRVCDDLAHRLERRGFDVRPIPLDDVYDYGLFLIESDLRQEGTSLSAFPSMPAIQRNWQDVHENPYIIAQLAYNRDRERDLGFSAVHDLNVDQRAAFDVIFESTTAQRGKTFFLHGPGGTGKTFLYNALCHRVRAEGWIVLCVASSGIAALLLPGGHTAHSTFSIPVLSLSDDSCCQIDKQSQRADMLRTVRLIIWDEAVTQHRYGSQSYSQYH